MFKLLRLIPTLALTPMCFVFSGCSGEGYDEGAHHYPVEQCTYSGTATEEDCDGAAASDGCNFYVWRGYGACDGSECQSCGGAEYDPDN